MNTKLTPKRMGQGYVFFFMHCSSFFHIVLVCVYPLEMDFCTNFLYILFSLPFPSSDKPLYDSRAALCNFSLVFFHDTA